MTSQYDDPAVAAMLAEYSSLREESLNSIGHRLTIISFTFGALSVVIAGLLTRRISDYIAGSLALVFIPQMVKATLLIWLGEYNRSQRAGRWIARLEVKINERVGFEAVGWEKRGSNGASQSGDQGHMSYPYRATILLLLGTAYSASALGIYFILSELFVQKASDCLIVIIGIALTAVTLVVEILFLRFFMRQWRVARKGD